MKLKFLTSFLVLCLVGFLAFNFMDTPDPNADATPYNSGISTSQGDTTPPGGFPYPTRFNWNYSLIPGVSGGTVGATRINGNYILNRWNNTSWYRYADTGPGGGPGTLTDSGTYVGAIRDMTIKDGFLFGGQAAGTLYKMNPNTLATITTFSTAAQFRAIAYDPNRKGFWGTNFSGNILCYDTAGVLRGTITSALTGKYGAAWDSASTPGVGAVWAWSQGTGSSDLVKYNASTGAIINTWTFNAVSTEIAGGAEITVQSGRFVLALNYQNFAVAGYDLGPAGPPPGGPLCFNRNGIYKSIPDNLTGTARDTINVTNNSGTPGDITVVIDTVIHTWIGDLVFDLQHGGETDSLFAWIGTGTFGNSSDNLFGIRLTDSASSQLVSVGSGTPPPGQYLTGGRTGVDSLKKHFVRSGNAGSNIAGQWILNMHDRAGGDTGSLRAWHICFYGGNLVNIVSSNNQTPDKYTLSQNYPNPFNPSTKINFAIPKAGFVSLKVYDMLGREVKTLVAEQLNAGEFIAEFNGAGLSSGTYFYRLEVGDFVQVKKMVLLK